MKEALTERGSNRRTKGGLTERGLMKGIMQICKYLKTTSMPSGNFLLFLPTKGAFTVFFRCLQKKVAHFDIVIFVIIMIIIIMSLLADIFSNGDAISCSLLVQAWTCED